ncbi:hypothetical protein [Metallibacterium sp.]|uniref:hypothetical protein n=1 Tax=Metallibacterium sp. TaxID=2940281 RepID=UPI002636FC70|nr:hypothetical protein [Metallibacterium sp.]
MMRARALGLGLAACAVLLLAGCEHGPTAAQREAAAQAQAATQRLEQSQQELKLYREMLARKDIQLAASLGQQIEQMYPRTPAASAVARDLPALTAAAAKQAHAQRLAALWDYQTGVPMAGGTQNTASINDTRSDGSQGNIQLILRRHSAWGQSVYLYAHAPGFVCKSICRVPVSVDGGKPQGWAAYLPPTGEPALFIKDDRRFIGMLEKAQVIELRVDLKQGGARTLKYEVGGFKPASFPPLAKKG